MRTSGPRARERLLKSMQLVALPAALIGCSGGRRQRDADHSAASKRCRCGRTCSDRLKIAPLRAARYLDPTSRCARTSRRVERSWKWTNVRGALGLA
jgi:hypothetical protein